MKSISSVSMSLPRYDPETTLSIWMFERICNGGICRYDLRRRARSRIQQRLGCFTRQRVRQRHQDFVKS